MDIKNCPTSTTHDLLAILITKYGAYVDNVEVTLPDGTGAKLPAVELRIPKKAHDDLAQQYFLNVSQNFEKEELVLQVISSVGTQEILIKA